MNWITSHMTSHCFNSLIYIFNLNISAHTNHTQRDRLEQNKILLRSLSGSLNHSKRQTYAYSNIDLHTYWYIACVHRKEHTKHTWEYLIPIQVTGILNTGILKTSGWMSGCLSVGQTAPLCHLAAPGYVSLVSYSMSLAAFSFQGIWALFRQCCQWVLNSTVVSSKSSDVILTFPFFSWPLKYFLCTHTDCWHYVNG